MNSKKGFRWGGFAALFVPLILLSIPTTQAAAQGPPGQVVPAQGQMPSRSGVVVHRPFAPSGPDGAPTVPIDNANVSDSGAPQNETAIAVDPTVNLLVAEPHLVGSANDYRLGDTSCGFYNSTDGGDSWSAGVLARPEIGATSVDYAAGGDPSVAVGPDGVAQVGCLYFTRDFLAPSAVVVHTVDFLTDFTPDNFDSTKVAEFTDVSVEDDKEYLFHDKPYIAVDTSGGDHNGNVYVSWTIFSGHQEIVFPFLNLVFDEARIHFARSTDGGANFSPDPPLPLSGFVAQGSVPAVGPNGEVYVVWQKFPENSTDDFDILLRKSTDGGEIFGSPVTVVDGVIPIPSPLPNGNYRVNSFPSIAVDTSGGADDGKVYVVYAAQNPSRSDAADIFITVFPNGGGSWSTPIRVNDDNTTNAQFFPWVSVGPDGKVNVVWYDRADDPEDKAIHLYADHSSDGGSSFAGNMLVSDFDFTPNNRDQFRGEFIGDYNGVASLENAILPLWTTLVVSGRGRNRVQDYEAFFDVVDTAISPPPPGGGDMHVGGLSGSSRNQGSRWRATVTITVHDDSEAAVADATVNGNWSPGGPDSCTTGSNGQCNVNLRRIDGSTEEVTFTVNNVTRAPLNYDSGDNHNPGSEITVSKPF